MILNNNIVVSQSTIDVQKNITINLDDITLSKLNYILNNLNIKHLPGYWTLEEVLKKENINKNELVYSQAFTESCVPVLEHIKIQISRFYIFNIIERKILKEQKETELSKLLSDFVDITSKKIISKNNVLTEEIISKLLISNLNTIFNKYSNHKLKDYYDIILVPNFDDECKNKDYFNGAIDYVSKYNIAQLNISVETRKQVNKKVYKI